MGALKRVIRTLFDRGEALLDLAFGQRLNLFTWLGALGWYFFWIATGTGVYLYVFFDTGITEAYQSLEYITHDQWYLAGVMRSLHRYASDALVVVVFFHLLREFSLDRLRGKRFFAWLTGIPTILFIYVCGISGYWLVWDELAQYIAIATAEWLDTLPFFGEPIANNFLDSSTLSGRFFTLMVFIHIFAPLFLLILMWVHVQRHARARVNPPRPLAIGTAAMLIVLSLVYPAVSQAPADLDVVPTRIGIDWFYLFPYPLLDYIPGGQLWLFIAAGFLILAILPWAPPAKPAAVAAVSLDNCNGCGRCFDDCPFGAITMIARSDGKAYETEAAVTADACVSCGICVGACPTATPYRRATAVIPGIELPDHRIAVLRDDTLAACTRLARAPRVLVYACDYCGAKACTYQGAEVISMPCLAMLPPSFVDFALSRGLADGVALAGCASGDCYYRLGDTWTSQRLAGERDPYLRDRVDRQRVRQLHLRPTGKRNHREAIEKFRAALGELPPNPPRGTRQNA